MQLERMLERDLARRSLGRRWTMLLAAMAALAALASESAVSANSYDCSYTGGPCYKCRWFQGSGSCTEWSFYSGYCNCDEPGPGQGCILWNQCFANLRPDFEIKDRQSDSLDLESGACSIAALQRRPRAMRDWSEVRVVGASG